MATRSALIAVVVGVSLAARAPAVAPLAVHWMAPFFSGGGYCSEAIAFVAGLARFSNLSVSIDQHGDSFDRAFVQDLPADERALLTRLYQHPFLPAQSISICHSEPGAWHPARYPTSVCPAPTAAYAVGRTMFETDRLPAGWADRLNAMDEVWVPTAFHAHIFERDGVAGSKLHVLGEPVDTEFFDPARVSALSAAEGGLDPADGFAFLSIFKWEYRKGWDVLLKAYLGAFTLSDPVVLYVLTNAYHSTSDFHGEMQRFIREHLGCDRWDRVPADVLARHGGGDGVLASTTNTSLPLPSDFCVERSADLRDATTDAAAASAAAASAAAAGVAPRRRLVPERLPRIRLLRRVPQRDLPRLYKAANAFVLPSRGEGWGRPHCEAMAMGLPVIATNWSGPTEFLDETNGYPLPFSHLRPIPVGPFAGHAMAEPSELDLRSLLRHVVEAPDEARRKGARARADMIARFHPRVFAERLEADVRRISDAVAARARAQRLEARRRERGEEKEEDVEREEDGVAAPLRRFLSTMRERFWAHKSAEAPQAEDGEAEAEDRRKEGGSRSDL